MRRGVMIGLAVVLAYGWGCAAGAEGTAGNACYANGSCDAGLTCESGVCVATADGGDAVDSGILDPPSVSVVSPEDGEVFQKGETVTLTASAMDDKDAAEDLEVSWSSDVDGLLAKTSVDEASMTTLGVTTLSPGEHVITITATDTDGLEGTASVSLMINAYPTMPAVKILPVDPTTVDSLTADVLQIAEDPNRASTELTPLFRWFKDGEEQAAYSGPLVPAEATVAGETWEVRLSYFDGLGYGEEAVDQVTIANSAPTCTEAVILPSAGNAVTPFTCGCNDRVDPDGDLDAPQDRCQFVDEGLAAGIAVVAEVDAVDDVCVMPDGLWERGDAFHCLYIAGDGVAEGEPAQSGTVIIQNAAPTAPTAEIWPDAGGVETYFTCNRTADGSDPDGDPLSYQTVWTVNGYNNVGTTTETVIAGQLAKDEDGTLAVKGDTISCAIFADDLSALSPPGFSAEVTLGNTVPTGGTVLLGPFGATEVDVLTCDATGAVDPDTEDDLEWTYVWLVDGEEVEGETGSTLTGAHFDKGQVVTCVATPTDGSDAGEAITSKLSVVIQNTLPQLTGATLTSLETNPLETNLLGSFTCVPGAWIDPDPADSVPEFAIAWYHVDALGSITLIDDALELELAAAPYTPGDAVFCELTPSNGADVGEPVISDEGTIINHAPVAPTVSITPDHGTVSTTFTCEITEPATDSDGDAVTLSYGWSVNGVIDPAETGPSVLASDLDDDVFGGHAAVGDSVRCQVVASDGLDSAAPAVSDAVVLDNTPPVPGTLALAPEVAYEQTTLTCIGQGATDPDGQSVGWVVTWSVDGAVVPDQTGISLNGTHFDKGQTVTCSAAPTDGESTGDTVEAGISVTISNTLPVVEQVVVSPEEVSLTGELSCTYDGWFDPDPADAEETVTFQWYQLSDDESFPLGSGTTDTFYPSSLMPGATVLCRVTPLNGAVAGVPVDSNHVTVINQIPTLTSVTLTPEEAYADSLLTCTAEGFFDGDGDVAANVYAWQINGGELSGASDPTLVGAFVKGDTVRCVVTPSDGLDEGAPELSNPVTIGNKLPVIGGVNLSPSYGASCSTWACESVDVVDPDVDDVVLLSTTWFVNGEPVVASGSTFSSDALEPGDVVSCEVTASDGTVGPAPDFAPVTGPAVAGSPSEVYNTPPTLESVELWTEDVDAILIDPGTVLTCKPIGYVDPECDPVPQYVYKWYLGAEQMDGVDTSDLDTTGYPVGTTITCQIIPGDEWGWGAAKLSNTVTLSNLPPQPPYVAVEAPDGADGDLTCEILEEASDADPMSYTWLWTINDGEEVVGEQVLDASQVQHCDRVGCRVEVSDGTYTESSNTADAALPFGPHCDDGNACTDDVCATSFGCEHTDNVDPCEDDDKCTSDEACLNGECVAGTVVDCTWVGNPCIAQVCNPASGACNLPAEDGIPCSDGDLCNGQEACSAGQCVGGIAPPIDDGIGCTVDSCDPELGVLHVPDDSVCQTGLPCVTDSCVVDEGCVSVELVSCCGNGFVEPGEGCDDGNQSVEVCLYGQTSCQVCNSQCQWQPGGTSYCGDTVVDIWVGESCDDGNGVTEVCGYGESNCTICNEDCQVAAGATSYCGDGQTDPANGEGCDDGNTLTETCEYGSASCVICTASCQEIIGTASFCGDGIVDGVEVMYRAHSYHPVDNPGLTEASQFTQEEKAATRIDPPESAFPLTISHVEVMGALGQTYTVYLHTQGTTYPGAHLATFIFVGTGAMQLIALGETVTVNTPTTLWVVYQGSMDGMTIFGDGDGQNTANSVYGCSTYFFGFCLLGVDWGPMSSYGDVFTEMGDIVAGVGSLSTLETCDDGNATTEACPYGETQCTVCGEICHWTDGMTSYCGDWIVDAAYESCDDGDVNTESCPYGATSCVVCSSTCQDAYGATSYCGDGLKQVGAGETCDDGNTNTEVCDYGELSCGVCDAMCHLTSGATSYCGDGDVDLDNDEACDDGGLDDGDGCGSDCQLDCGGQSVLYLLEEVLVEAELPEDPPSSYYLGIRLRDADGEGGALTSPLLSWVDNITLKGLGGTSSVTFWSHAMGDPTGWLIHDAETGCGESAVHTTGNFYCKSDACTLVYVGEALPMDAGYRLEVKAKLSSDVDALEILMLTEPPPADFTTCSDDAPSLSVWESAVFDMDSDPTASVGGVSASTDSYPIGWFLTLSWETSPTVGCFEASGVCGDGGLDDAEDCDDGNLVNGDGCNGTCGLDPVCGDGVLEAGETCDE